MSKNDPVQRLSTDDAPEALRPFVNDQLTILGRSRDRLARPADASDRLDAIDRRIAEDDQQRLAAILTDAIDAARRHEQHDARTDQPRLNVRDFGALGDGQHDDGPALRQAVDALRKAGPGAVLDLPRGDYRLGGLHDEQRRAALMLHGLKDVTLQGAPGVRLIATEIGGVLGLHDCENIRIRRIVLDHDPLPFTQGRIEAVNVEAMTVDWRLDPGFTPPDRKPFATLLDAGGSLDASLRHLQTGQPLTGHSAIKATQVQPLQADLFRLHLKLGAKAADPQQMLTPGSAMCLHTRGVKGNQCALWVDSCRFCLFEELRACASYYFTLAENHCTANRYVRCAIEPYPGRFSAVNADGFHCNSNRHGPWISQTTVLNTMDDTGNLYCRATSVMATRGSRTIVVHALARQEDRPAGWDWQAHRTWYREGDLLLIVDPQTGEPALLSPIEKVEPADWNGHQLTALTLADDLPPLLTREATGKTGLTHFTEFLHRKDDGPIEHFAMNMSTKSDGFVIRDCHMGRNTVTAWKLKASNGLIVGNRFEQHGWCCLSLYQELMWQEGFAVRNVLVQGNTFQNRFGIHVGCGYPIRKEHMGPPWVTDLDIVDNRFVHNDDGWSARINQCRQVQILDNAMPTARPLIVRAGAGQGITVGPNRSKAQPQVVLVEAGGPDVTVQSGTSESVGGS